MYLLYYLCINLDFIIGLQANDARHLVIVILLWNTYVNNLRFITIPDLERTEVYIGARSTTHSVQFVRKGIVLYVVVSMGTTEAIAHL